jgi:hypothetical protein
LYVIHLGDYGRHEFPSVERTSGNDIRMQTAYQALVDCVLAQVPDYHDHYATSVFWEDVTVTQAVLDEDGQNNS